MKPQAAIFDLDGTLTDSMYIWDEAPRELVRRFGGEPAPNLAEVIAQMSREEAAHYMIDTFKLRCTVQEVLDGVNDLVTEAYRDAVPAKPGAAALLERLAARGIPCGIATASEDFQARMAMERLGLWGHFRFAISCIQYGSKRCPDIYWEAARRLGSTPERTIVFEDAPHAARTAKAAGFWVAGVQDASADEQVMRLLCDWYLPRLDEPSFLELLTE